MDAEDMENLFMTADFSRNPAHREALRQRLFGADGNAGPFGQRFRKAEADGRGPWNMNPDSDELSEDMLEQAAGGVANVPPDWRPPYEQKNG